MLRVYTPLNLAAAIVQAARQAVALKQDVQALSKHVKSAARVIGWLEYDHDDPQGRLEYVGQLVRQTGAQGVDDSIEDGLGCMTWADGATYAGEFRDGCLDGFGHETYTDGSTYKGQFARDSRQGLGVYSMQSGERYTGGWQNGERHGLGFFTLASQGHQIAVMGNFVAGELERQVVDDRKAEVLQIELNEVLNDTMEIAALARNLAPEIRDRAEEAHQKLLQKERMESTFAAAILGPRLEEVSASAGPDDPEARPATRPPKSYDSWETWLEHIDICHKTTKTVVSIKTEIFQISANMRKLGYDRPAKLLPLLADTEAFDSVVDSVGLKAKQSRSLWKAMEDLNVVLTPRSIGHEAARGPNFFEVDQKKMQQLAMLFERFCERRDRQNQPRMGTAGLHNALVYMNVPHEIEDLRKIMSRLDTNNDGDIDLEEFIMAATEIEQVR